MASPDVLLVFCCVTQRRRHSEVEVALAGLVQVGGAGLGWVQKVEAAQRVAGQQRLTGEARAGGKRRRIARRMVKARAALNRRHIWPAEQGGVGGGWEDNV